VNAALYAAVEHHVHHAAQSVQAAGLGQHTGHIIMLFFPVAGVAGLAVREWLGARRHRHDPSK
jgi:triosephosphate isomerase